MDSPILHLDTDVWTQIARYLDYDDISQLVLVGQRHFTQRVGSGVQSFVVTRRCHAVDLECILRTAKATPHLQELNISVGEALNYIMKPLLPLELPPKLTTLTATFNRSVEFFTVSHDLAKLAPSLLTLSLWGATRSELKLANLKLPSKLSSLSLNGCILTVNELDIAKLPRSLTSLKMPALYIPKMTHNEWPSELLTLSITALVRSIVIEHLPRTLTSLKIDSKTDAASFTTSFKTENTEDHFAFPWRCFFHSLIDVSITAQITANATSRLKSLVSPHAYNASDVADFIASGFWHLQAPTTPDYPLFEQIRISSSTQDAMVESCRELAPYLQNVTNFYFYQLPLAACVYLPKAKSYLGGYSSTASLEEGMPTHFKHFAIHYFDNRLFDHLSSCNTLRVAQIIGTPSDKAITESVAWPSSLTHLSIIMTLSGPALLSLPNSITFLSTSIPKRADWSIIATHLVVLKDLTLSIPWLGTEDSDDPLHPITSNNLQTIVLKAAAEINEPHSKPYMDDFFGNASPLPASLTAITLSSYYETQAIPMTILPSLPRNLKSLTIMGQVSWNNENYKTEPHVASLSQSELLASLPSGLDGFDVWGRVGHSEANWSVELLASLPQNLKRLSQDSAWSTSAPLDIDVIIRYLPPKLAFLHFGAAKEVSETYFNRSYLYHGERPSAP